MKTKLKYPKTHPWRIYSVNLFKSMPKELATLYGFMGEPCYKDKFFKQKTATLFKNPHHSTIRKGP